MNKKFEAGNVVINKLTNTECVVYRVLSDNLVCVYTVTDDVGTMTLLNINCLVPKECSKSVTGYCSYKSNVTSGSVKDICTMCEFFNS